MSALYIVGTPIGNLGDFSPRAIETLETVDFIAAEDTRVSLKLLNYFEISKPMVSYHQHNEKQRSEEIISRISSGESCALVTDAGMPAISDPGEFLVKRCAESGIEVIVIPGPTAAMSALAISGLSTRRFYFEGFLEGKSSDQKQRLLKLKALESTIVFYESPHSLISTLGLLLDILGDRHIAICREITKIHEEVLRMKISEVLEYYSDKSPRGEYVIVVEGAEPEKAENISEDEAISMVLTRHSDGVSLSTAAKEVAEITGYKKGKLYKKALDN